MICCQFIFKPGTYDDEFHRLDAEIDDYARALPGFDRVEKWLSPEGDVVNAMYYFADRSSVAQLGRFPQHRQAKGQVARWYDGYRIVVSDVSATYGDGRLPAPPSAHTTPDSATTSDPPAGQPTDRATHQEQS
ncbi:hypothetical protein [Nocardioides renjunii]|uniref:hypothetical protein n=1 Tax=Nocardioides renjunii TaxID=3095075 RepID=UPI002B0003CB|nr:hypothetical protein [Nocardioides sp. S-34]WQQ20409.1 hypothetical protein SHK17_10845 [Nocardioides sp. S-34]